MKARRLRLRMRLPSFRDLNQVTVGIIATAVVVALVAATFAVGTLQLFTDRYDVWAVFDSTGGIKKGAHVRLAGVNVGRVSGVHPDFERGQVVLNLEIDSGIELGPAIRAEVAPATLLGGYYVRLSGPIDEPFLEDLPRDDDRRRIPLERTQGPISLVSTLSDTTSQVQAIDIDAVNDVISELAGATQRNGDLVPSLVNSISSIGAAVAAREQELRDLVANAEQVTATLATRDQQILQLIDTAVVLLDTLSERRDQLATILDSGSDAVTTLTATITTHRAALDTILAETHVLLDGVGRSLPVINTSLAHAGPIFSLLAATANEAGGFDVAVEGLIYSIDHLQALLSILFPVPVPPFGGNP